MLSKSEIQFVQSLQLKKHRQREGLFIAEGVKIVGELINSDYTINSLFGTENWIKNNASKIKPFSVKQVSDDELKKISSLTSPNETLAVVKMKVDELDLSSLKGKLTLVLDNVQDPGNFGTLIRIADWFGVETILCSTSTVEVFNPKVIQATMGSFLRVKTFYGALDIALNYAVANDIPNYAAVLNGENIYTASLSKSGLLVFGNESKGISDEVLSLISRKITIPSFSTSKTDSLNVSIAAALFCSEFKRS
jgi:RNA methyltransferase, TrmH family